MSSLLKTVYNFWKSESKSRHSSTSLYCCSSSSRFSIFLYQCSLCIVISSHNQASRKGGVQDGRIVKSWRHVMVAHDVISNKDYVLRDAAAMVDDFSKLGNISVKKYEAPLADPVGVCGFEKALSAGQLIYFGDPVRPVMDCIEQLSTSQIFHSRVVSLYIVTRFLTALITGKVVPAEAQLPWLPDEISKVESLMACFESG